MKEIIIKIFMGSLFLFLFGFNIFNNKLYRYFILDISNLVALIIIIIWYLSKTHGKNKNMYKYSTKAKKKLEQSLKCFLEQFVCLLQSQTQFLSLRFFSPYKTFFKNFCSAPYGVYFTIRGVFLLCPLFGVQFN
jgi:hypothetical protein